RPPGAAPTRQAVPPRSIPQPVERAAVEFACRSYKFVAANLGQHTIKRARIRFFVGHIAPEDAFRIALAEDRECLWIAGANARGEPVPFRIGRGEHFLGLIECCNETTDRRLVLGGP